MKTMKRINTYRKKGDRVRATAMKKAKKRMLERFGEAFIPGGLSLDDASEHSGGLSLDTGENGGLSLADQDSGSTRDY